MIPETPSPPYYAVIFTSKRNDKDKENYGSMADEMVNLAQKQEGYIGYESYRNDEGYGVTISYWRALEHISNWKRNMEHRSAQKQGQNNWYSEYKVRIAKVERDYGFESVDKL